MLLYVTYTYISLSVDMRNKFYKVFILFCKKDFFVSFAKIKLKFVCASSTGNTSEIIFSLAIYFRKKKKSLLIFTSDVYTQ